MNIKRNIQARVKDSAPGLEEFIQKVNAKSPISTDFNPLKVAQTWDDASMALVSFWDFIVDNDLIPEEFNAWNKLSGKQLSRLLIRHPEFADKADWPSITGWELDLLLKSKPEFADRAVTQ